MTNDPYLSLSLQLNFNFKHFFPQRFKQYGQHHEQYFGFHTAIFH